MTGLREWGLRGLTAELGDGYAARMPGKLGRWWFYALAAVPMGAVRMLTDRWKAYTALPGARFRDPTRGVLGEVVALRGPGHADLLVVADELVDLVGEDAALAMHPALTDAPPYALVRVEWDSEGSTEGLAPAVAVPSPWLERNVELRTWMPI